MTFCCECRGPCRRTLDLPVDVYRWLRTMGAVVSPECAKREHRTVKHNYFGRVVVVGTNGPRIKPPIPRRTP